MSVIDNILLLRHAEFISASHKKLVYNILPIETLKLPKSRDRVTEQLLVFKDIQLINKVRSEIVKTLNY